MFPYDTSGPFAKFSEFVFDIQDTKGRKIHLWSMTNDIMNKLVQRYRNIKPGVKDNIEYLSGILHERITNYVMDNDESLWFDSQQQDKKSALYKFIADCSLKIVLQRCNIKYDLNKESAMTYEQYFINENGILNDALLMKCLKIVQRISANELQYIKDFVIYEKGRIRDEQRKNTNNDYSKRNGINNESRESIQNGSGNEKNAENDGNRSIELSGTGENTGIRGTGSAPEQEEFLGEKDSQLSNGELPGTDAAYGVQREIRKSSGSENGTSDGTVRYNAEKSSGKDESPKSQFSGESIDRTENPGTDYGSDRQGNFINH